jgi:pentose-5-phosphate-3-epimerase
LENSGKLKEAGVDVFVVGNTVFSAPDPKEMIRKIRNGG